MSGNNGTGKKDSTFTGNDGAATSQRGSKGQQDHENDRGTLLASMVSIMTSTNNTATLSAASSSNTNATTTAVNAIASGPSLNQVHSMSVFMTDPKILKKTKTIFDEKQKLKIRISTLQSILDSFGSTQPSESDSIRFFREYDTIIHSLVLEYYWHRLDKLRKLREGKNSVSVNQVLQSKELAEFLKVTALYRRWMCAVFVPEYLKSNAASGKLPGWKESIRSVLTSMLLIGNHSRIRTEGSRILILLLKTCGHDSAILTFQNKSSGSPIDLDDYYFIELFKSIAPLQNFVTGTNHLFVIPKVLMDSVAVALPFTESPIVETNEMLEDLLQLVESEQPSQFLFELFKTHYMENVLLSSEPIPLSPEFFKTLFHHMALWIMSEETEFLSKYNLHAPHKVSSGVEASVTSGANTDPSAYFSPKEGSSFSQALQYYLLSQSSGILCLHELIRRIFGLSFTNSAMIQMCLHMIVSWIQNPTSVPRFFLFPASDPIEIKVSADKRIIIPSTMTEESALANSYLRVYVEFALSLFDGRPSVGLAEEQQSIYSRVFEFICCVASEKSFILEIDTWDCLMDGLLQIVGSHLMQSNKYAIISSPSVADNICYKLAAVLFYVWTKSTPDRQDKWNKLQTCLSGSTRWLNVISQWNRAMLVLTHKLAFYCFDINVAESLTQVQTKSRRGTPSNTVNSDPGVKVSSWKDAMGISGGSLDPKKRLLWDSMEVLGYSRESQSNLGNPLFDQKIPFESLDAPSTYINGDFFQFEGSPEMTCGRMPFLWDNMLCILGNPNRIERPEIHCAAIKCLATVWEILFETRNLQPHLAQNRPPLFQIVPWLIETCGLPLAYADSKAIAYECLCRIMCRRHEEIVDEVYFLHFYRVIIKGLCEKDDRITHAILKNSCMIFNLCLPGSLILVPFYVSCAERMLLKGNVNSLAMNVSAPSDVRQVSLQILSSICAISSLYTGMEVPRILTDIASIERNSVHSQSSDSVTTFLSIKNQVLTIFLNMLVLQSNRTKPSSVTDVQDDIQVLNCMCLIALEELLLEDKLRDNSVFESYLSTLTEHLFFRECKIVSAAIDCLSVFLDRIDLLFEISPICVSMCVEKIAAALLEHLEYLTEVIMDIGTEDDPNHGSLQIVKGLWSETICKMILCLEAWAVRSPYTKVMGEQRLRKKIFGCLDAALSFGKSVTILPTDKTKSAVGNSEGGSIGSSSGRSKSTEPVGLMAAAVSGPLEGLKSNIREMAELVLSHLCHNLKYYPTRWGSDVFGSLAIEPCVSEDAMHDDGCLFFCFLDKHIISLQQVSGNCHIILRDCSGRFVWDACQFYEKGTTVKNVGDKAHVTRSGTVLSAIAPNTNYFDIDSPVSDGPGEVEESLKADVLHTLLKQINKDHPDCFTSKCQDRPFEKNAVLVGNLVRMESQMRKQIDYELSAATTNIGTRSARSTVAGRSRGNSLGEELTVPEIHVKPPSEASMGGEGKYKNGSLEISDDGDVAPGSLIAKSGPPSISSASFQSEEQNLLDAKSINCEPRKFLSQMGFMFLESMGSGEFCVLNKTPALMRDIRGLDRKYSREIIKLAILYVAEGDEDESRILGHSSGSAAYHEFVASLGWTVDLNQHSGYTGGLDKSFEKAVYYADSMVEMIFHDVTMLPTDPHDLKQIKKKRHIGNDHVHIVWNEHFRDYKENTIRGDFGNVQIIITPLPNSLFAIDLYRLSMIPLFGPLVTRSVVSRNTLGPLVRMTALNAYRLTFQITMKTAFKHPYWQRSQDIQTIVSRHCVTKCSTETIIKSVIP